jgi:DNA-binding beta-propeller fold protein YncE
MWAAGAVAMVGTGTRTGENMNVMTHLGSAGARVTAVLGAAAVAAAAATVIAGPASAAVADGYHPGAAVFVQTDNTVGNQVVVYDRSADGTLRQAGTYPTGGLGGQTGGSAADHLSSQGSLSYDPRQGMLYAVNAGSNTVSVFGVSGDRLSLRQVIGSGGTFPVSVAVRGDLVYVLNAENGGAVQGYRMFLGRLFPIPGANRPLGLDPTATPQFTHTPGQVAFSPGGSQLIVTTKANGNDIDVFGIDARGSLSAQPVVNSEPGTIPFGVVFDPAGQLVVAETGINALATYALNPDGTVTLLNVVPTGQEATCWVAADGNLLFASNAASNTESGYVVSATGQLTLLGSTPTDPGTTDAAVTPDGRFLYVQAGTNGIVDEFAVTPSGPAQIGSVTVPGAVGGEGIAAS